MELFYSADCRMEAPIAILGGRECTLHAARRPEQRELIDSDSISTSWTYFWH